MKGSHPIRAALLLVLVAWFAGGIGWGFVLTSADDHAYSAVAVALVDGEPLLRHVESPMFKGNFTAVPSVPGAYASKFPLGVSFLLSPFYALCGYAGMFFLGPLMAALGVLALYDLAKRLTQDRSIALLAAALLATVPGVISCAGNIGSDVPSMTLLTVALCVYVRHLRQPRVALFALFGVLMGASFLVRNPNALLVALVGVHQLFIHRGALRSQLVTWVAGALAFLTFVAVHVGTNLFVFGAAIGGYGGEISEGGFALRFIPHHFPRYLVILCASPPLGLLAMTLVLKRRRGEQHGIYALLACVVAAFVVLYSAWWALAFDYGKGFVGGTRFVVPVLPVVCLFVAVAVFDEIAELRVRRALIGALLVAQLAASVTLIWQLQLYKDRMATHRDRIYASTTQDSLVFGPSDWSKLLLPHRASEHLRRYASYGGARHAENFEQELSRLADASLAAGKQVFVLKSGREREQDEARAIAALEARYRLVTTNEYKAPYKMHVMEVTAR